MMGYRKEIPTSAPGTYIFNTLGQHRSHFDARRDVKLLVPPHPQMDPENCLGLGKQDAFRNGLVFVNCLQVVIFWFLGSPYNHNWISEGRCSSL